jgi:outer membrane protein assembly complex protein YaeT
MRALVLVCILAALVASPARAQSVAATYAGKPIEDVRLLVENAPTNETALVDLIGPKAGQTLSIGAVRESIAHLYGLGRFQDVQVEAAAAPGGGVRLTFNLIPLHSIRKLIFAGTLNLPESLLRSTIIERYGTSPPLGRIDAATRTLEQLYADHGYLRARVDAVPEILHNPDRTELTFTIKAGSRAMIGKVTVDGDPRAARDEFLQRLGATTGQPFERPRLQARLDDYVKRLKQRRFYQADGSLQATESEDATTVGLAISIHPGLPVSVRFEGDPLPADRLSTLAPLQREGSVDEDLLEDSETRIENYLKQQGYWKAEVTVTRQQTDAELTIVFRVTRGRQYRIAGVPEINGAKALPISELHQLVALKPGELFVESQLTAGENAIRQAYRQRGYDSVDVKSAVNEIDPPSTTEGLVRPAIVIAEGSQSTIGDILITGNTTVTSDELRALIKIRSGGPYYEPHIVEARDAMVLEYLNRGFESVVVSPASTASDDHTRVTLVFTVQEGPQTIVDHILIVGNVHTNPDVILRELQFRPGQPFGMQDEFESRRRLSALGLFRRVRISELNHGGGNEHDVLITVEEAPMTSIGYGGGVEVSQRLRATGPEGQAQEQREFAPRGFFDIGRRNLFGANRTVSLYTRVALRPKDAPDDPTVDGTGIGFVEYRVVGTYRQPRWFGPNDLTVTGVVEQGVRSTFNFARRGFNVDVVRRLTPLTRISGRYSLSSTRTFDERLSEEDQATIDRLFPQVRLSGFSGAWARDTRDDLLDPSRGLFVSAEGTLAARALGGQVGFMKTYVQGYTFKKLPGPRRIIFATRGAVGLADGFEREVQPTDDSGNPVPGPPIVIDDLPASERFFAGGDTSIRGFALDAVGAANTISSNGFPTGGNAVFIFNGELRVPIWRDLGAVAFVDGGNVFRRVTEIDFGEMRGSVGFGVRYKSPIGPIRVDLGFKLDRREIAGQLEKRTALHFSLGQAF